MARRLGDAYAAVVERESGAIIEALHSLATLPERDRKARKIAEYQERLEALKLA